MSATYTIANLTNKGRDYVRFLIDDTDTTNAFFDDDEIDALLSIETSTGDALPFYTAARLLEIILTRYSKAGKGLEEKQVEVLRLRYGIGKNIKQALREQIESYRKRGSWLLKTNKTIRTMGTAKQILY